MAVRKVYMRVTKDKYELPVAIADTAAELARICGTTTNAVISGICHEKKSGKRSCYKKVVIKE